MGKRVALLILVLLVIAGAILWVRSTRKGGLPTPAPVVTEAVTEAPVVTKAPAVTVVPLEDCTCTVANGTIQLNHTMGDLPRTCANQLAGTQLNWRSTDNSKLQIKIPDWGTQPPTTPGNPYPAAQCPANPGTACLSGALASTTIQVCDIPYSITTTSGVTSKKHFGHIVIVRP